MYEGKLIFAQVMEHLPLHSFRRIVTRYSGERKVKSFSCLDQFLCMAFAQLTFRESLRDIEACLRAQRSKLYHLGIRSTVARNTLANANAVRPWQIYADFAQSLIAIARPLYVDEPFGVDLKESVYALDTTTIDLCLSVFPWAPFRSTKAAVKLHTLLDLRGNIPTFIHISDGKMHEVNVLDQLLPEAGAFYIMDRGFLDFERLFRFHEAGSFFVTRAKSNFKAQRRYSHPVDRSTGLVCDQTVLLTGCYSRKGFEAPLQQRRQRDQRVGQQVAHRPRDDLGATILDAAHELLPAFTEEPAGGQLAEFVQDERFAFRFRHAPQRACALPPVAIRIQRRGHGAVRRARIPGLRGQP